MEDQAAILDRFQGLLVGTAVGDALGLPREGLSASRAKRMFGPPNRHCFIFKRGMISDDTEHSLFVAQSLILHSGSVAGFERRLAWALRWWFLSLPAGIGLATLKSILRSWIGFPPAKSGVFSAGNGPAMRSAAIGACFYSKPELMYEFVRASSRMTHTDPRAEIGARVVAAIASRALNPSSISKPEADEFLALLNEANLDCDEWTKMVDVIASSIKRGDTVEEFSASICRRDFVSGYVFQTVPVAAYSWFVHFGGFEASVEAVLNCGGDADTTGAIIGALAGASVGFSGIPADWIDGVVDWPRSTNVCAEVSRRLFEVAQSQRSGSPVKYFWPGVLPRNLLFFLAVLFHGFRRLAPPY